MTGGSGEDLAPQGPLSHVVRRSVDADQYLAARRDQLLDGIAAIELPLPELFVVPGVLADRERNLRAIERVDLLAFGRHEVTRFIEDIVRRQQHLGLPEPDTSFFENRRAV